MVLNILSFSLTRANLFSSQSIRRGLIPRITLLTSVTGKNPSMPHQLVQCTEMRVPQDTFPIRTDCPIFPILFSLPSSFRTNSSRRTVFLAVCLEVSDVQESVQPVPAVSSARSANKQVPAACVMRKPLLEDYLFYKELRQVLPERVDEILADEAVRSLSSFVSSPRARRERARWQRSFHCGHRREKGQPQCSRRFCF